MKKNLFRALAIFLLGAAIGMGYSFYANMRQRQEAQEAYEALATQAAPVAESVQAPAAESVQAPAAESVPEESQAPPNPDMERQVDFVQLQSGTNKDIYAWISIPGTRVDYPILQHPKDDSYYLLYNLDGSKGYPGCIYTERANAKDFTDFNTVIYGHNMKNGTMFHDLHLYKDKSFLEEHPYVYVYTQEQTLQYQIFAAYAYDDRHLLYSFDYSSPRVREGYLAEIQGVRSISASVDTEMELTADSKIITLSTCIGGQDTQRFLVQAALVGPETAP